MTGPDDAAGRRLAVERERLVGQVADLAADLQAIIDASADSNTNDEHDPEGATIGFERAQVASLLERARTAWPTWAQAEARLRSGTYGGCERCGDPIAAERLVAHPTATACVPSASTSTTADVGRSDARERLFGPFQQVVGVE